ncbi:MAG: hypothetical protein F6K19_47835 [Cyanothece sp. SIO1E1]|nr:hypothetical protein [Cyanothece sp. SIO1E1]
MNETTVPFSERKAMLEALCRDVGVQLASDDRSRSQATAENLYSSD